MATHDGYIGVRPWESNEAYEYFTPHASTWGLQDVSKPSSGRDLSGVMHKERLGAQNSKHHTSGQKVKLELSWSGTDKDETARILQAFNPEYLEVNYPDALTGTRRSAEFYVGDRSANVWRFAVGAKIYETVSFNIIEV